MTRQLGDSYEMNFYLLHSPANQKKDGRCESSWLMHLWKIKTGLRRSGVAYKQKKKRRKGDRKTCFNVWPAFSIQSSCLHYIVAQAYPPYYPHKQISTIATHPKSKHDILPIPPADWPGRFHLQPQQVWGLEAWPVTLQICMGTHGDRP